VTNGLPIAKCLSSVVIAGKKKQTTVNWLSSFKHKKPATEIHRLILKNE